MRILDKGRIEEKLRLSCRCQPTRSRTTAYEGVAYVLGRMGAQKFTISSHHFRDKVEGFPESSSKFFFVELDLSIILF